MAGHPNFYENLKEAQMRLLRTVVTYDGEPYYVGAITNHMKDGIFRVYLLPLATANDHRKYIPGGSGGISPETPSLGPAMDQYMVEKPNAGILRKHMNSPAFNKFRPFPLGMCNQQGKVYYVERSPQRHREQGLTTQMANDNLISLTRMMPNSEGGLRFIQLLGAHFADCIKGSHPSAQECLRQLHDPDVENEGVAFHRNFALIRGPINMMFLAYKSEVIGVLPNNDFSRVRVGRDFVHTREAIAELNLFGDITLST